MLDEIISIHEEVVNSISRKHQRYLYHQINWDQQAICLLGSRGVGKTTLMCQYLLEKYGSSEYALYISADNVFVLSKGLFATAMEYFRYGGQALFIDEIHKYPNWSLELKNIIDTYKHSQVIFSASSSLNLNQSKYDLSRRVVYYELPGLSFREYLNFTYNTQYEPVSLDTILHQHPAIARQFKHLTILKVFKEYLKHGYFPFFLEGREDYLAKVNNIIEKIIFEDIAVVYNLRQSTLTILKKLLWLVATSKGLAPNIDRISKNLQTSRETIYDCLRYLEESGLLISIYTHAKGMKLIRKPSKIYLQNTSLHHAINGHLKFESDPGSVRETFFVNQLSQVNKPYLHEQGDFIIDHRYIFEIGGPSKNFRQIKNEPEGFLAIDGIEIGFKRKVPLYLFGFLY